MKVKQSFKRILYANPWWHQGILNRIAEEADSRGWHLDFQVCMSGRLPSEWDGDGIITQLGVDREALEDLRESSGCPAISLNLNFPEIKMPRVSTNQQMAGRLAAEHFLEREFTNFAFCGQSYDRVTSHERYQAFRGRLQEEGHDAQGIWLKGNHDWKEISVERRRRKLARKLAKLQRPIAVFALNDMLAVEVIEAALAESLAVPDEVAVLGMLDMPVFRRSTAIGLSSIRADLPKMARVACDMLSEMMEGREPQEACVLLPPKGVVVRDSTDTIAARRPRVARTIRYMLDHFAEPIGLKDFTKVAGLGKTRLYAAFESDIGQSPYSVLTRIRMDKAKRMLLATHDKVSAVAYACGFGTAVNMHRQFKKHLERTPAEYRRGK